MSRHSSDTRPGLLGRILRRRSVRVVLVLTILTGFFLLCVPFALRYTLTRWLLANGADQAVVKKITLNPFTGTASLRGVDVIQDGRSVIRNSTIVVSLSLRDLFSRAAVVEKAHIEGVTLDVELTENGGLRIGSYLLRRTGDDSRFETSRRKTVPGAEKAPDDKAPRVPWVFRVRELTMENVTLHYVQPSLVIDLVIDKARLARFTTDPDDHTGTLSLEGRINRAPVRMDLSTFRVIPNTLIQGTVGIKDLDLSHLSDMLKVWLDPFAGQVSLAGAVDFAMALPDRLEVHYDGTIDVGGVDIAGSDWQSRGDLHWQGQVHYGDLPDKDMVVNLDGSLSGGRVAFAMPSVGLGLDGRKIAIRGKVDLGIGRRVKVHSTAALTSGTFALGLDSLAAGYGTLDWQGRIDFVSGDVHAPLRVDWAGRLKAADSSFSVKEEGEVRVGLASLDWEGKGEYSRAPGGGQQVVFRGKTALQGMKGAAERVRLMCEEAALDSNLSLRMEDKPLLTGIAGGHLSGLQVKRGEELDLTLDRLALDHFEGTDTGGMTLEQLTGTGLRIAATDAQPYEVELGGFTIGKVSAVPPGSFTAAKIRLEAPRVTDQRSGLELVRLADVEATGIRIGTDGPRVEIAGLALDKGRFLEEERPGKTRTPQVTLSAGRARALTWNPGDGLSVGRISFDGIFADIVHWQKKETDQKEIEAKDAPPQKREDSGGQQEAGPRSLPVRVGLITVSGTSGLRYSDTTLTSPFTTRLDLAELQIKDLDLSRPEQPFVYTLKGNLDRYAPLAVQGTCAPLAEPFRLQQSLKLRNYSMSSLSPYVIEAIGTRFESGQMDLTSTMTLTGEELDSKNTLFLKNLTVKPVRKELADKLNNQLPVPLDIALSMLRDGSGNITLRVPLRGKLSEISVGLTDVIVTALSGAITTSVTPYLAYTVLGPGGALAYLGFKAGQAIWNSSVPELSFGFGQAELTDDQKEKLDAIGKKIKADRDREYSLCARVNVYELPGVREQAKASREQILSRPENRKALFDLGTRRARNVKEYLVKRFGIREDRLLICNPGPDFDPDRAPVLRFRN